MDILRKILCPALIALIVEVFVFMPSTANADSYDRLYRIIQEHKSELSPNYEKVRIIYLWHTEAF